ncbi:phage holin family protein [Lysobacter sp. A378]
MSGTAAPGDQQSSIDAATRESMRERLHTRAAKDEARADDAGSDQSKSDHVDSDQVDPDLLEAIRQLGLTGRASLDAAGATAKSLRSLVAADVSLARSALGRALAFTGVAIAFGGSAWLLLMTTLVVVLKGPVGMSWAVALLISALFSVAVTAIAAWMAMRYFEHTRLQATRRQLARLGIGELADFAPGPESPDSAREVARQRLHEQPDGKPAKDEQGVSVTPP